MASNRHVKCSFVSEVRIQGRETSEACGRPPSVTVWMPWTVKTSTVETSRNDDELPEDLWPNLSRLQQL